MPGMRLKRAVRRRRMIIPVFTKRDRAIAQAVFFIWWGGT
jgi:hypothetical protein